MEVIFTPATPHHFFFFSEAPASKLSSPRGRWAGRQARPELEWKGAAGRGSAAPPEGPRLVFPSYLGVPLSQVTGEAGPWHKNGRAAGSGGWEETPHRLWPTRKAG